MGKAFSWANLLLIAAIGLTVAALGSYFLFGDNPDLQANLGLIGITYFVFLWPGYFVLRLTERKPTPMLAAPPQNIATLREQQSPIQKEILRDISKFVYLKETHMQDQLTVLRLGVKTDPELPKLIGYREEDYEGKYALILQFDSPHVPLTNWQERQPKLNTFFGKDVMATVQEVSEHKVELALIKK